jgi:hypothetical protein
MAEQFIISVPAPVAIVAEIVLGPIKSITCPECGFKGDTLWRICDGRYLCNACGLRWKKGQVCPECLHVYYKSATDIPGAYKKCQCGRFMHAGCARDDTCKYCKM